MPGNGAWLIRRCALRADRHNGAVENKRLLVLGAGPAQLGLLAAARRLGVTVVAADRDPSAPGFRYADRRAIVSVEDEPALERLARAERVDGVIAPGSDRSVAVAARIAEKLGVPHPLSPDTAGLTAARRRERDRLREAGVPQVDAIVCRSLDEIEAAAGRLGYPCAVGAGDRQGQRGLVSDPGGIAAVLADALADSRSEFCLVEQLPPGREVNVNGFSVGGRFHPLTVTGREPAPALDVSLARVWPSAAGPDTLGAAVETSAAAAAALGIREGPTATRLVVTDDGPRVVRVSARLGGGHDAELCRAALGVDLNGLAARTALGEPVAARELEPANRVGGACIRFLVAAPGELRAIAGLEEAFALPGVRGIRVYRRPGYVFDELRRPSDRAGAVLAVGRDREDALQWASRALELIRFETVNAEALV